MEEHWYTPTIVAFLRHDVPMLVGLPSQYFERDIQTLVQRVANEGEAFLTKTLPGLGKAIDLALQGHTSLATSSFKKRGRSALPAFLSALLRRVFLDDGYVRHDPCIRSVRLLRQLCFWCKKVQKGYSDESLQKAVIEFKEIDAALPESVSDMDADPSLLGLARVIVERIFHNVGDPLDFGPKHGPGAVASGEDLIQKRELSHSFSQLERVFRPVPWFRSLRDTAENPDVVLNRMSCQYGLSRLAFVEKDSSGPRLIGLEPAEYMWCQQAVKRLMYDHIENRSIARGQVNFTDQTINRELARNWKVFETLDMSKASDRNSYALVEYLFGQTKLWPYLRACRTPGTVFPDGTYLLYRKFAPMGSAVCFPVQACVYYALAVSALHLSGMPLSFALHRTFVYGDDIVVPRGSYSVLDRAFQSVGLKFNTDKCCTHGKFRESCGLDAYDSNDVTPVRLRVAYPKGATDLPKLVEHANALFDHGYWEASAAFRELAMAGFRALRDLHIPYSTKTDLPILAWRSHDRNSVRYRTVDGITTVAGWVYTAKKRRVPRCLTGVLLRESLSLGGPVGSIRPKEGGRHLDERYVGYLRKRRFAVIRTAGD